MADNVKLPGSFMIGFLLFGLASALPALYSGGKETATMDAGAILKGQWASLYEKHFNKGYPFYQPVKTGWGTADYALFREGRDGVLVGSDGWLFTTEEFAYHKNREQTIAGHLSYIEKINRQLESRGISLVVALVPAKSRLYQEKLGEYSYPSYNHPFYGQVVTHLSQANVVVADIYNALEGQQDAFLKTDTHWTPQGAQLAAQAVSDVIHRSLQDITWQPSDFSTHKEGTEHHQGDLTRYIPISQPLPPEVLDMTVTRQNGTAATEADLFGDAGIPVTLVGTSYSANPLWNFAGYLKEALQADVLNAADEGKGPFATMQAYLSDASFTSSPPQLIIWEIPERYIALPDSYTPASLGDA